MKGRRMITLIAICVLLLGTAVGCTGADKDSSIVIGGILSLTGKSPIYGSSASNGIKLAIKQVNESGGVLGKRIEYIQLDDQGVGKKAEEAYKELKKQKVLGIIGAVKTEPGLALAQISKKDGIPIITPCASPAEITTYGNNLFRVCFIDPYQSREMASFAYETLKARKFAIFYEFSDIYSGGSARLFGEKAEALGAKDVYYKSFSAEDTDFSVQLGQIKRNEPDVMYVPTSYESFLAIVMQARKMGIEAIFLGNDGTEGVLSIANAEQKALLEGVYFSTHYLAGYGNDKSKEFDKAYEQEYGTLPDSFAALGYDAAMLMLSSIQKAGEPKRDKVIKEIDSSQTLGVTGPINLDTLGDPKNKPIFIIKISGGQYTLQSLVAPDLS